MKLFKYFAIAIVVFMFLAMVADFSMNYFVLNAGNIFSCVLLTILAAQPTILAYVVILSILALVRNVKWQKIISHLGRPHATKNANN